jgi:hypothetical protein
MPAELRTEIEWRLKQGGMAEIFRVGTLECVERIFQAGLQNRT